ncbi:MAG TPA: hypothetical protein VJB57_10425 [Dehalococcoidia bacterium]|nr:hypothetical protein [Dehalococcoidia bacterium]
MAARDQLIAYGYVLSEDGKYRRPGKLTQVWQELEDSKGWLRFEPDGKGNEVPEVYKVASHAEGTSGLSKFHHPSMFDWVYPEEHVEKTYKDAVEFMANLTAEAAIRKGKGPTLVSAGAPAVTSEQLAAMQNAQAGQAGAAMPKEKHRWPWQN